MKKMNDTETISISEDLTSKDITKFEEITSDDVISTLGLTIKKDENNKLVHIEL